MTYGLGRVYRRGRRWWIGLYVDGVEIREPGGKTEAEAARKLKRRLREADPIPRQESVKVAEILEDYLLAKRGLRSISKLRSHSKALVRVLGRRRALAVTPAEVDRYKARREREGRAPATIARELELLRAAYRHASRARRLSPTRIPHITVETVHNARQGFLSFDQVQEILVHVKDSDVQDFLAWSFWTAMRPNETRQLTWRCVDSDARTITLPPQSAKIKRARTIALEGELMAIIERRQSRRIVGSDLIFHRKHRGRLGYPVKDYRKAWAAACRAAGFEPGRDGVVPYDLRRSGLRSWVRAGVAESTVMKVSGHLTRSTFDRYNVVDVEDTRIGLGMLEEFLETRTKHAQSEKKAAVNVGPAGVLAEAGGNRTIRALPEPGQTQRRRQE